MKRFFLGCGIAFASSFLAIRAEAGLSTCWWQMQWGAERLEPAPCYVSAKNNSSGHLAFDVVEKDEQGYERVVVLLANKIAEVTLLGKVYKGHWSIDSEEDIWIRVGGGSFAFRLPPNVRTTARPRSEAASNQMTPTLYETMSDTPFYWKR